MISLDIVGIYGTSSFLDYRNHQSDNNLLF